MPARRVLHDMVPRTCPICSKPYEAHPVRLRHGRETTCSRACSYERRTGARRVERHEVSCVTCGKQLVRAVNDVPAHGHVCDRVCLYAGRSQGVIPRIVARPYKSGSEHALWLDRHRYYGANWKAARAACYARDGRTCQECGLTEVDCGRALDVHHIVPFRKFTDHVLANALSNLITLCPACHGTADAAILRADREAARTTPAPTTATPAVA